MSLTFTCGSRAETIKSDVSYSVEPESDSDYKEVAENFLRYLNSDKKIVSIKAMRNGNALIGHLITLNQGGYILVPATRYLPPVKAYSLNSDFDALPKWYQEVLINELSALRQIKTDKRDKIRTENSSRWDFLLSYTDKKRSYRYKPDTFLLKTTWNQGYPYNKKLPKINNEHVWAGCAQAAQAQIMKYYNHPRKANGVVTHHWNGQVFKAILYKTYNWDIMPDSINTSTPEYIQDEIALLMRDLSIVNHADYGLNGSSASTDIRALTENFGYATGIDEMTNDDEDQFFETLRSEIDDERPVLLSFVGCHVTVADGYASDPTGKKIHINMGWGGSGDEYYYLNDTVVTNSHTFPPNLNMIYNIRPCSPEKNNCYVNLEDTDTIENFSISGRFNDQYDMDSYEVYLKGSTQITGSSGYYQGFYIMVYNADRELLISQDDTINLSLPAGKYAVKISLRNEDGWHYTYEADSADYMAEISTETLTADEISQIEARDIPPVITNDFEDLIISSPHKIRIDALDEDGDDISFKAVSSDENAAAVNLDGNILTITPLDSGISEIKVKAKSGDERAKKTFRVLSVNEEISFGKEFTIDGVFDSQEDFNTHKVILDGECSIWGYGFKSVLDSEGNYLVNPGCQTIEDQFERDVCFIGNSLEENPGQWGMSFSYNEDGDNSYTLFVSCPDADTDIDVIAELLELDDGSGPSATYYTLEPQITGGNGSIEPGSELKAKQGSTQVFTLRPDPGYQVAVFTDNGENKKGELANNEYRLSNIRENHVICVAFEETPESEELIWLTSKADAISKAQAEDKKVLLLAGREICGNTTYMRDTVCESLSPPVNNLLSDAFILWFCDVDSTTDYYPYASGLGNYMLPLICCIDPDDSETYLDRTTGTQTPDDLYSRLESISVPDPVIYMLTPEVTGENGNIEPGTAFQVNEASAQTFTLMPDSGFRVAVFTDNGEDKKAEIENHQYTLSNIRENHVISVSFEKIPAPAPENVSATDGATYQDKVCITWCAVPGAAYYKIYRGINKNSEESEALTDWQSITMFDDTSVTPGEIYYYRVRAAINTSGADASEYSHWDTGSATLKTVRKGDINADNLLDLTDAILTLQILAGEHPSMFRSDYSLCEADIDDNSHVSLAEAVYALRAAAAE